MAPQAVSREVAGPAPRGGFVETSGAPEAPRNGLDELSAEEWQAFQAAAQGVPDGERQLAAMAGFLRFQKAFVRWEALRSPADRHARQAMTRQLLDGVVDLAASGSLPPEQAQQIQDVLVTDLEPDPERRETLRREQGARLPHQVQVPVQQVQEPAAPDARRPDLLRPDLLRSERASRQSDGQLVRAPV